MKKEEVERLLPMIDGFEQAFNKSLSELFGQTMAHNILDYARAALMDIIPVIPPVSLTSPWLKNIIGVSYEIGIWKQLEQQGMSLEDISILTWNVLFDVTSKMPKDVRQNACSVILSSAYNRKISDESKKLDRANNWQIDFINTFPDEHFDIGLNIMSCPIIKLCRELDVERYVSYFCKNDYATYAALGITLTRNHTLAEGNEYCDFRLSKNQIYE